MACRLVGAKPLSEPFLEYSRLTHRNNFQRNLNQNSNIFIQENTLKMTSSQWRPFCHGRNEAIPFLYKPPSITPSYAFRLV